MDGLETPLATAAADCLIGVEWFSLSLSHTETHTL